MKHHGGRYVGSMECEKHDCPGFIKYSRIGVFVRPLRGFPLKDGMYACIMNSLPHVFLVYVYWDIMS